MPEHLDIGNRMKQYEHNNRKYLERKVPVIIRIDGRVFHTFTRGFEKPFDEVLVKSMQQTTKYLCENIQGCKFGYTQSDEISLLLTDYDNEKTDAWFRYNVQKLCSIAASMATLAFNKYFLNNVQDYEFDCCYDPDNDNIGDRIVPGREEDFHRYDKALKFGATFDARCFNLPKDEVANYFYWRQLDAMRNSIQMVGQENFSHRELQNKTCEDVKSILLNIKGIDYERFDIKLRCGACCYFKSFVPEGSKNIHKLWLIDYYTPIFKDNRDYINRLVYIEGEVYD